MRLDSARAVRLRNQRTRYLVARMRREMPWVEPVDLPAMRAWAELEIISACIFSELLEFGIKTPNGEPDRMLAELRNTRRVQLAFEVQLGMTPMARQALKTSGQAPYDLVAAFAQDAANERAAERKAIEARPSKPEAIEAESIEVDAADAQ